MPTLQENLSELDHLDDLLSKIDLSGLANNSENSLNKLNSKTNQRIEELKQDIIDLQIKLDSRQEEETKSMQLYKETLHNVSLQQQQMKVDEDTIRKESVSNEELEKELAFLDKHLEDKETENDIYYTKADKEQLKLALFRGVGVQMIVEDDLSVRKANLTSHDTHDIATIQIDAPSISSTNKIWNFISKNL